jgi:hypothetical protein
MDGDEGQVVRILFSAKIKEYVLIILFKNKVQG